MPSYRLARVDGVSISTGNTKLGPIPSVSLAPQLSCSINGPRDCIRACYARKLARLRRHVAASWESNARIWAETPLVYFGAIRKFLSQGNPDRFRWHVAGDIPTKAYYDSVANIAVDFPKTRFLAFSKSYDILARRLFIPSNLTVRVSAWPGLQWTMNRKRLEGRYAAAWVSHLKESDAGYTDTIPSDAAECPGSCVSCDRCWDGNCRHVVFRAH